MEIFSGKGKLALRERATLVQQGGGKRARKREKCGGEIAGKTQTKLGGQRRGAEPELLVRTLAPQRHIRGGRDLAIIRKDSEEEKRERNVTHGP